MSRFSGLTAISMASLIAIPGLAAHAEPVVDARLPTLSASIKHGALKVRMAPTLADRTPLAGRPVLDIRAYDAAGQEIGLIRKPVARRLGYASIDVTSVMLAGERIVVRMD